MPEWIEESDGFVSTTRSVDGKYVMKQVVRPVVMIEAENTPGGPNRHVRRMAQRLERQNKRMRRARQDR